MALLSNKDLLRRVPIFASLTEAQLETLASSFVKKKFRNNAFIFRQGMQSDAFFAILVGRVHVTMRDEQGREVIFCTLKQGDYFGEMSLIDGKPHSTSVKAVVACELLMIERQAFQACMPELDSPENRIMLSLVSRLRTADKKIESLALQGGQERIFKFLKENSTLDEEGHPVLRTKISGADVARNVGSSRELVTRIIKKLKDNGSMVQQADGSYRLMDF